MWSRLMLQILLLPLFMLWTSSVSFASSPVGVWLTSSGKAKMQVSECGESLCAEIVWTRVRGRAGGPPTDKKNPNPSLRDRPIIGLSTFSNMQKAGDNLWIGTVYDPRKGVSHQNVEVSLENDRKLKLRGCRANGLACRHKYWTRTQ